MSNIYLDLLKEVDKLSIDDIEAIVNSFKPYVKYVYKKYVDCYRYLVDNNYSKITAKEYKCELDAFMNEGFTRDEAISLLLARIGEHKRMMDKIGNSTSGFSTEKKTRNNDLWDDYSF